MYEAKNSKICNFCTFWPLVNRVIDQNIQKLLFFAVFASYIASILNEITACQNFVLHDVYKMQN